MRRGTLPVNQTAAEAAYLPLVHSVMRRLKANDANAPSVQAEALRCWALMHGLACLQLSGNLSACLGRDVASASPAALQNLIASLLLPANHAGPTVPPAKRRTRAKSL